MEPTDRASLNESLAGGKLASIEENLSRVTPSFLTTGVTAQSSREKKMPAYWNRSYIRIVIGKMPRWTTLLKFPKMLKS